MRSLKILHILRAPIGGLFRHVADLAQGQIARGHHVGIIADSRTANTRSRELLSTLAPKLALGVTLTPIYRPFGPNDLTALVHVIRRVRRAQPDIVHGHGAKGGAYARLTFAGKPMVRAYTPHGGSLLLNHASLAGKTYLALEKMLMPRGDLYICESAYSAKIFNDKIGRPRGPMRVVHNGVARDEFSPVVTANDATDIVFLGELRPVKGVDVLIDAIAVLHSAGTPLTATLVGDGPQAQALREHVTRLGLEDAIRFAPPMPARAAMALGRVMVIPSRAESLPYVVLETAAAGKPLITTMVGGVPEIYGPLSDNLVPAGDAKALARAIAQTIEQPKAANDLALKLRTRVAASFTLDAMVDGVLAAYQQAIESAPLIQQALMAHV